MRKFFSILLLITAFGGISVSAQDSYPVVEVKVSTDKVRVKGKSYYTHVVTEKQTLYSISKAYKVSTDDIIHANPKLHLDKEPLKEGSILLVPVKPSKPAADIPVEQPVAQDSTALEAVTSEILPEVQETPIDFSQANATLSLLLPFAVDTTANKNYLNFYFGALLAVKELADKGMTIEINAIDSENRQELSDGRRRIAESDIIIGPVSGSDIAQTLRILPDNKYLVSPLDSRTENWAQSDRVILAATSATRQIEDVVDWLAEDMAGGTDTLIVVRETGYKMTFTENTMSSYLSNIPEDRKIDVDYSLSGGLEMNEWFDAHTHLKDSVTRVIAASEHDIFIDDVIRNVYLQNNMKKNTIIYGPAKTKSDEMDRMCDARLHSSVTYHIDYTRPDVIKFVKDFRALYGGEPDNFAFHGYDTAKYFLCIYAKYGDDWAEHLSAFTQSGLQTYFRFEKPQGWEGAVNAGLRRLVYSPGFKVQITDR